MWNIIVDWVIHAGVSCVVPCSPTSAFQEPKGTLAASSCAQVWRSIFRETENRGSSDYSSPPGVVQQRRTRKELKVEDSSRIANRNSANPASEITSATEWPSKNLHRASNEPSALHSDASPVTGSPRSYVSVPAQAGSSPTTRTTASTSVTSSEADTTNLHRASTTIAASTLAASAITTSFSIPPFLSGSSKHISTTGSSSSSHLTSVHLIAAIPSKTSDVPAREPTATISYQERVATSSQQSAPASSWLDSSAFYSSSCSGVIGSAPGSTPSACSGANPSSGSIISAPPPTTLPSLTLQSKTMSTGTSSVTDGLSSGPSSIPPATTVSSIATRTGVGMTASLFTSSKSIPASPLSSLQPTSSWLIPTSDTDSSPGEASSSTLISGYSSSQPNPFSVTAVPIVTTTAPATLHRSSSSTSYTTVETGALQPAIHSTNGFAANTGAIIGVSLSAAAALIAVIFVIFFTCKKYRSRCSQSGSTDNILSLARSASWRRPVDDDESFICGYSNFGLPSESTSQVHVMGEVSHPPDTFNGPIDSTMRAQPISSGLVPSPYGSIVPSEPGTLSPPSKFPVSNIPGSLLGRRDGQTYDHLQVPSRRPVSFGGSRRAIPIAMGSGTSSNGHGTSSSSSDEATWETGRSISNKILSSSMPNSRRHSSTAPAPFLVVPRPMLDYEGQNPGEPHSDRRSMKSFIGRLRSRRKSSAQSVATTRAGSGSSTPFTQIRGSEDGSMALGVRAAFVDNVYSPSLLNPPIALPPQLMLADDELGNPAVYWPPVRLPSAPSLALTDASSMAEGLLHPRLAMGLDHSQQASMTSFRDNEDYTRPINGLVKDHLRSTITFEIQETVASEDGAVGIAM